MELKELETLLDRLKKIPIQDKREANLFSVGARGHYENPISDVLAFYLDPYGEHGLNTLVLETLLTCLPQTKSLTPELPESPAREVVTNAGNRIDILLEGNDWVMVIENKIWHAQNNPFADYAEFLRQENFQGKTSYHLVLSPKGEAPVGWLGISYPQLTQALTSRLSEAFVTLPLNKWLIFLREYILHMESLMCHQPVVSEIEQFVLTNLHRITNLAEIKTTVIKNLLEEGKRYLNEHFSNQGYGLTALCRSYYGCPMLRFSFEHWQSNSDVVLYLNSDPEVWHSVYICASELSDDRLRDKAIAMLNVDGVEEYEFEKKNTIILFYSYHNPENVEKTTLWKDVARRMELLDIFEREAR